MAVREWLEDFRAAVMFLTILPVAARGSVGAPVWPRLMRAFPLAGALVGAVSGAVLAAAVMAGLAPLAAALAALAAGVVVSGGMHEDGLADVADGLGGRTAERRLEIMRDPSVGAFGVMALVFAIGFQAVVLGGLITTGGALAAVAALVIAHAVSRFAALMMLAMLPAARGEGSGHRAGRPGGDVVIPAAIGALVVAGVAGGAMFAPLALAGALACGMLAAHGVIRLCGRMLGGQTGDAAGAVEVVTRLVVLGALAAFVS